MDFSKVNKKVLFSVIGAVGGVAAIGTIAGVSVAVNNSNKKNALLKQFKKEKNDLKNEVERLYEGHKDRDAKLNELKELKSLEQLNSFRVQLKGNFDALVSVDDKFLNLVSEDKKDQFKTKKESAKTIKQLEDLKSELVGQLKSQLSDKAKNVLDEDKKNEIIKDIEKLENDSSYEQLNKKINDQVNEQGGIIATLQERIEKLINENIHNDELKAQYLTRTKQLNDKEALEELEKTIQSEIDQTNQAREDAKKLLDKLSDDNKVKVANKDKVEDLKSTKETLNEVAKLLQNEYDKLIADAKEKIAVAEGLDEYAQWLKELDDKTPTESRLKEIETEAMSLFDKEKTSLSKEIDKLSDQETQKANFKKQLSDAKNIEDLKETEKAVLILIDQTNEARQKAITLLDKFSDDNDVKKNNKDKISDPKSSKHTLEEVTKILEVEYDKLVNDTKEKIAVAEGLEEYAQWSKQLTDKELNEKDLKGLGAKATELFDKNKKSVSDEIEKLKESDQQKTEFKKEVDAAKNIKTLNEIKVKLQEHIEHLKVLDKVNELKDKVTKSKLHDTRKQQINKLLDQATSKTIDDISKKIDEAIKNQDDLDKKLPNAKKALEKLNEGERKTKYKNILEKIDLTAQEAEEVTLEIERYLERLKTEVKDFINENNPDSNFQHKIDNAKTEKEILDVKSETLEILGRSFESSHKLAFDAISRLSEKNPKKSIYKARFDDTKEILLKNIEKHNEIKKEIDDYLKGLFNKTELSVQKSFTDEYLYYDKSDHSLDIYNEISRDFQKLKPTNATEDTLNSIHDRATQLYNNALKIFDDLISDSYRTIQFYDELTNLVKKAENVKAIKNAIVLLQDVSKLVFFNTKSADFKKISSDIWQIDINSSDFSQNGQKINQEVLTAVPKIYELSKAKSELMEFSKNVNEEAREGFVSYLTNIATDPETIYLLQFIIKPYLELGIKVEAENIINSTNLDASKKSQFIDDLKGIWEPEKIDELLMLKVGFIDFSSHLSDFTKLLVSNHWPNLTETQKALFKKIIDKKPAKLSIIFELLRLANKFNEENKTEKV
ncbi:hypothetical protein [Mycoplasmopsis opalescens]|uniref:hypothetical protein n=1 Tax=Mycoplasmopsis opalescens TaxID=114886 RepID=UPI00055B6931|nr:hypothetical protein [Mycoplasmopsis opalescens]